MQFRVGIATDIGRKRSQNQDNCISLPELGLFVVADGMGGHLGGETASATAVETIANSIRKAETRKDWDPVNTLTRAIETANKAVFDKSIADAKLQGMGTTTTALLFKDQRLTIGHVGDSRCYFLRPSAVWQATRDHSLVQEKLRAGLITREEMKTDRMKNVITRSVGFEPVVNVEIFHMMVQSGDCFLICSDGLSGMMEDSQILEIVQNDFFNDGHIQGAVDRLIEAANKNGGDDNVTVILIQAL